MKKNEAHQGRALKILKEVLRELQQCKFSGKEHRKRCLCFMKDILYFSFFLANHQE